MLQKERYDLVLVFLVCQDDSYTISSSAAFYHNPFIRSFVFYRQINLFNWVLACLGDLKIGRSIAFLLMFRKKNWRIYRFLSIVVVSEHYCVRFLQVLCVVVALFFIFIIYKFSFNSIPPNDNLLVDLSFSVWKLPSSLSIVWNLLENWWSMYRFQYFPWASILWTIFVG